MEKMKAWYMKRKIENLQFNQLGWEKTKEAIKRKNYN
jgi:hypothetical protein